MKATVYGNEAGKAAIGRTPIVRVTIIDTNTNKVVKIAYIKFRITEVPEKIEDTSFGKEFTTALQPITCGTSYAAFDFMTQEMNTEIYNKLGLSSVDFDTRYELDTDASGYAIITDAEGVGITGPFVKAGFVKDKGGVTATGTRNLTWQIGADEVWSIIAAGNAGKTIGVRVTYKPKTGYNLGNVYFEFYAKINVANISDTIVPARYFVYNY